jgi:hypothetical protein
VLPTSSSFAGSRPLVLVILALLAGLILGGALMNMRREDNIAPPAPTPPPSPSATPQAQQPQPAPSAPVG